MLVLIVISENSVTLHSSSFLIREKEIEKRKPLMLCVFCFYVMSLCSIITQLTFLLILSKDMKALLLLIPM